MSLCFAQSILALAVVVSLALSVNAETVTFGSLTGSNGQRFFSTVESDYSITAITDGWKEGHLSGNGTPSLFSTDNNQQLEILKTAGAIFNLIGFETNDGILSSGMSSASYEIEGFLNNTSVLQVAGAMSPQYEPNLNPAAHQNLDRLRLTFDIGSTNSFNIDNIRLRSVPEPSSLLLLAMACTVVCYRKRNYLA